MKTKQDFRFIRANLQYHLDIGSISIREYEDQLDSLENEERELENFRYELEPPKSNFGILFLYILYAVTR